MLDLIGADIIFERRGSLWTPLSVAS